MNSKIRTAFVIVSTIGVAATGILTACDDNTTSNSNGALPTSSTSSSGASGASGSSSSSGGKSDGGSSSSSGGSSSSSGGSSSSSGGNCPTPKFRAPGNGPFCAFLKQADGGTGSANCDATSSSTAVCCGWNKKGSNSTFPDTVCAAKGCPGLSSNADFELTKYECTHPDHCGAKKCCLKPAAGKTIGRSAACNGAFIDNVTETYCADDCAAGEVAACSDPTDAGADSGANGKCAVGTCKPGSVNFRDMATCVP